MGDAETLVRIEAFQAASLHGVQFVLDSGRASPFYGRAMGEKVSFEAPAGQFVKRMKESGRESGMSEMSGCRSDWRIGETVCVCVRLCLDN